MAGGAVQALFWSQAKYLGVLVLAQDPWVTSMVAERSAPCAALLSQRAPALAERATLPVALEGVATLKVLAL
jgi:hypothetical protein